MEFVELKGRSTMVRVNQLIILVVGCAGLKRVVAATQNKVISGWARYPAKAQYLL